MNEAKDKPTAEIGTQKSGDLGFREKEACDLRMDTAACAERSTDPEAKEIARIALGQVDNIVFSGLTIDEVLGTQPDPEPCVKI